PRKKFLTLNSLTGSVACAKRQPGTYLRAWTGLMRRDMWMPSYVPNFVAYGGTRSKVRGGGSRVAPTIRIRREPSQYCRTEWGHRQSSSERAQRRRKTWGRNSRYQGQSPWRRAHNRAL